MFGMRTGVPDIFIITKCAFCVNHIDRVPENDVEIENDCEFFKKVLTKENIGYNIHYRVSTHTLRVLTAEKKEEGV